MIEISFEKDGERKSVGWRMKSDKAATFEKLLELTQNAEYAYSERNRNPGEADSIPYFHYFIADAVIGEEHIPVKIQVRVLNKDSGLHPRYYTHNLLKKIAGIDSPVAGTNSTNIDSNAYVPAESTVPQSEAEVKGLELPEVKSQETKTESEKPAAKEPKVLKLDKAKTAEEEAAEKAAKEKAEKTELDPTGTVRYYPIDEEAAKRAKEMNSFSDYKPGSRTADYRSQVDEAVKLAQEQKSKVDPMYHEKIDELLRIILAAHWP